MIHDRIIKIEKYPWKQFRFLQDENLKKYNRKDLEALKHSIIANSFVETFKAWQHNGTVYNIDGYHRIIILKELEAEGIEVPEKFTTIFIDCANATEAAKLIFVYSAKYAKITVEGTTDFIKKYNLNLEELKSEIVLPELNFNTISLMDTEEKENLDKIPVLMKEAISQTGDLFLFDDKHRIMCGDSTKNEDVEKLMEGKKADMVFIDPPYAVNYMKDNDILNKKSGGKFRVNARPIIGDNLTAKECAEKLWRPAFKNLYENADNDCSFYMTMCQGGDQMMMMMMMMMSEHWQVKHELIWVKSSPVFSMGRLDYDYQHEPILFGWKKKHNFYGNGKFLKSTWEIPKPNASELHPTMKPIELIENAILNSSLENQIVLDLFLGSGSTLIAAEQTNRVCYGMEIDPLYIDVIIKRYKNIYPNAKIECMNKDYDFGKLWQT